MKHSRNKHSHAARAVVTGAGSGIGRSFALELGRRGGRVLCVDINLQDAETTVAMLREAGAEGVAMQVDVSRPGDMERLAATAAGLLGGPVTVLVNNAGVGLGGRIGAVSLADWQWCLGVNLWGVVHGCHFFADQLKATGRAGIINVASGAAFASLPEMSAYNTSKAAVVALSETLATELAGHGIRVNVLCPSVVPTNIFNTTRVEARQRRAMDLALKWASFTTSDRVARQALDDLDAGRLYTLPQPDIKVLWRFKRLAPGLMQGLSRASYALTGQ